jgi:uncharacterized membrane protein
MLVELLRLAAALFLLVLVPGFVLVQAAFPPARTRARIAPLERAYITVVGGIVLLILVGVTLGFLPHGQGRGYFQTLATGSPNVELALLAVTVVLFYVGLQRGAYPWIARRFPRLVHPDGKAVGDASRRARRSDPPQS